MTRVDGRAPGELRPVSMTLGFMPYAEGSCLVEMGETKVICTASVEGSVPRWMQGRGKGWVTAEYSMLPRSTTERVRRDVDKGRPSGRTQEIQRLIGRSLRAITDMEALGERTVWLDCDVMRADGGTRTASITGAFVALAEAFRWLEEKELVAASPLLDSVSAVSVGIVDGTPCLDLNYAEDSTAQVDMNVVMTGAGKLVEVQGTAEQGAFERSELDRLLDLATDGIGQLTAHQQRALGAPATE
ncbi:MAG TPA: ribonuclease PH [Actinomycetota bacterium]|nr:ribonuclease PH [Actinomycetota bacterium]